ncbi:lysylphosphatidylglycerol synthase transmembrane domain-containing protein [Paracoccus sp. PARArs4]|uniref:lysylphosphatidylglycerol synthase transmembrane domain-containing protein n=1 Tax=Paracoccus sp. PARArs4 TaxID=2853442 RepID=UPI0024A648CE|nr:lysylphosphatidylglycerol synthase transmembrane domain-containing protein [Paracoccus sp. PARArs4]
MTMARALRIIVAIAILSALWWGLDGQRALGLLAAADPRWLVAALAALSLQTLLSAWRWQITARFFGQTIPLRAAVAEYYLAQIVNQSLPGGIAGDAGRAYRARHDGGLRRAGSAVVVERVLGQVALLAVLVAGLPLPFGPDLPATLHRAILIGAVIAGIALLLLPRPPLKPRFVAHQVVLNLAITALNIAGFAMAARATGSIIAPAQAMVLVPLILLTMILPVTIAGWGLREGAAAALFPLIGASSEAGLAASMAFGLVFLTATLPGIAVIGRDTAIALTRTRI